jgi:hypothetical protein
MPLLNIVGSTCANKTFYVSFCFMADEIEESYKWCLTQLRELFSPDRVPGVMVMDRELALLNAVNEVFPWCHRQLCTWHIEKNVLVHAAKSFDDDEESRDEFMRLWTGVMTSKSKDIFKRKWDAFKKDYGRNHTRLLEYIDTTWIAPYKELFVYAWTDQHMHFGHHTTSRVEGSHKTLKGNLQVSTGDLRMVYDKIDAMLINQHSEYDTMIGANKLRTPYINKGAFYVPLLGHISHYALGRLSDQRHLLSLPRELPQCTGLFTKSMGLPCAHKMQERIANNGVLQLNDIHPHWYLLPIASSVVANPIVLEPAIVIGRGRPSLAQSRLRYSTSQSQKSTRRDPSAFERSVKSTKRIQSTKRVPPMKRTQPTEQTQPIGQAQLIERTQPRKQAQSTKRTDKTKQQKASLSSGSGNRHKGKIDYGNLSSLATQMEKGIVQHKTKEKRANTGGLSVHWQEDEQSIEGDDSEEDELAERELERLIASEGTALPLWTKEKDLVGMTRVGKVFVQSNMQLRNRQLNAEVRSYIKLFSIDMLTKI